MTTLREMSKYAHLLEFGNDTRNYSWTQTEEEVTITMKIESTATSRDVFVRFEKQHLIAGLRGQPALIDGHLFDEVVVHDSSWSFTEGEVQITLQKKNQKWWGSAIVGDPSIDLDLIEGTKYLDVGLLEKVKQAKLEKKREEERARAAAAQQNPQ
eukprot:TRINITY_DN362_c0_g1_i2.p1 TRINITY_DN362_c0_g1~~TRINITY_DN362_c0_g1_i2.p1  ORF type:complete len:155 (+),score=74.45 TRINITY_DN362_c0_g1_i2:49-513(+)